MAAVALPWNRAAPRARSKRPMSVELVGAVYATVQICAGGWCACMGKWVNKKERIHDLLRVPAVGLPRRCHATLCPVRAALLHVNRPTHVVWAVWRGVFFCPVGVALLRCLCNRVSASASSRVALACSPSMLLSLPLCLLCSCTRATSRQ